MNEFVIYQTRKEIFLYNVLEKLAIFISYFSGMNYHINYLSIKNPDNPAD
jgi:hypothetical protein